MNKKFSIAISGMALMATACLSAHAQDLAAMLPKPGNWWVMEWSNPDTRNSGVTEVMFVNRGKGVLAKLHISERGANKSGLMNCESNVTIAVDNISLTTCRCGDVVLICDPSDTVSPLKSKHRTQNDYAMCTRSS